MLIRPREFWAERDVELLLGTQRRPVDPGGAGADRLGRRDGLGYGTLIWAAGGDRAAAVVPRRAARRHPRHARQAPTSTRLRAELAAGATRAVVVGGGYIGLEAAAVLRQARLRGRAASKCSTACSRASPARTCRGSTRPSTARTASTIRLGAEIEAIEGEEPRHRRAAGERRDDRLRPRDRRHRHRAVGRAADRRGRGGGQRRRCRRSSAAPACPTSTRSATAPRTPTLTPAARVIRLESGAERQRHGQRPPPGAICGDPQPYDAVPWFWSNQYDLRLQTVGLSLGHDATVLRGDPGEPQLLGGLPARAARSIALDCVNARARLIPGPRARRAGLVIDPARLADAETAAEVTAGDLPPQ